MSGLLWPTRQKTPHPSPFAGSNSQKSILLGVMPVSNYWHCLKGVNLRLSSLEKKMEHSRNIKLSLIFFAAEMCLVSHHKRSHCWKFSTHLPHRRVEAQTKCCITPQLLLTQNKVPLHPPAHPVSKWHHLGCPSAGKPRLSPARGSIVLLEPASINTKRPPPKSSV